MAEPSPTPRPSYSPPVQPMSPHLQIWGWTTSMASSIAQRATGIALYAGSALLAAWLAAAAMGAEAYATMSSLLSSPVGILVLLGFTWAQMFHLCKGIVHLLWDSGHMIDKQSGQRLSMAVFAGSVGLTALIWIVAYSVKG